MSHCIACNFPISASRLTPVWIFLGGHLLPAGPPPKIRSPSRESLASSIDLARCRHYRSPRQSQLAFPRLLSIQRGLGSRTLDAAVTSPQISFLELTVGTSPLYQCCRLVRISSLCRDCLQIWISRRKLVFDHWDGAASTVAQRRMIFIVP